MSYRPTLIALLGLSLSLASCGGGSTTPPKDPDPVVPTTVTVQGSISEWKGGAGSLSVLSSDSSEVAQTTVAESGSFSINLPKDPTALKAFSIDSLNKPLSGGYSCSITKNTVTVGDSQTKVLEISSAKFTKNSITTSLNITKLTLSFNSLPPILSTTTISGSEYIYADRPTTVKGLFEATCTQSTSLSLPKTQKVSLNIDLNYVKGWNVQEIKASSDLSLVTGTADLQANTTGTLKSLPATSPLNFYTN